MNRHERRKANVMKSAIARANTKAVGMVCIEEIIRDPNTCVEDFLSRLSAIVGKLGDSYFAVVVQPGKVVHLETHEVCPFVWFMVNDDEIFIAAECVEPIAQHIESFPDVFCEFVDGDVGNGMRECRRLAIEGDPRLDKMLTLLAAETQGRA
jgi:hypothetical protein